MTLLLVAINAKYIHSNLAVYSLRAYAKMHADVSLIQIDVAEYTINQQPEEILKSIYRKSPDIVCFSCYIWNLTYVEYLITELSKVLPDAEIWLGGPEVSYDSGQVLERLPDQVRVVMKGEGEETFAELCRTCAPQGKEAARCAGSRREREDGQGHILEAVLGITFRDEAGRIRRNPWREPVDMDTLPFVYDMPGSAETAHEGKCAGGLQEFEHKIIYYETSRGCPFSCSYCLSSVDKRLRFRSLELVKRELQFFVDHRVSQVKFVDRTFNCSHDRTEQIWRYIAEHDNGITNFHFEVAADLLTEEEIRLIESMRPGLIQLEIGVQSTNPQTIREIRRTMDFARVRGNVERIRRRGNVHQHLDLIAGLPFEDLVSFGQSFDEVYALRPDALQLGFLKVLKGSFMSGNQKNYGLVHQSLPPYEVLYTKWLSYDDILVLKSVEEMVEVYYNSGQFAHAMDELLGEYSSAFRMYRELSRHYDLHHYSGIQHKRSGRYEILLEFVREHFPERESRMKECLIYDYYLRENAKNRPEFAGEYTVGKDFLRKFYVREELEHTYLPDYVSYDRSQMRKMTHIEYFPNLRKMLLFDYMCRNPLNQNARTCMIEEWTVSP